MRILTGGSIAIIYPLRVSGFVGLGGSEHLVGDGGSSCQCADSVIQPDHRTVTKAVDRLACSGWLSDRPERPACELRRASPRKFARGNRDHRRDSQFSGEPSDGPPPSDQATIGPASGLYSRWFPHARVTQNRPISNHAYFCTYVQPTPSWLTYPSVVVHSRENCCS
jgi:hypothetical protein